MPLQSIIGAVMSVILIGYRGSGKSTTGKKLAQKLWQKFVDTDDLIIADRGGVFVKFSRPTAKQRSVNWNSRLSKRRWGCRIM